MEAVPSMPTANTHEFGDVVVRLPEGAPVRPEALAVAPVPGACLKATTVSASPKPPRARVDVILARDSAPDACATQTSAVPFLAFVRLARAQVRPPPDTFARCFAPAGPSAATNATTRSPDAAAVSRAATVVFPFAVASPSM